MMLFLFCQTVNLQLANGKTNLFLNQEKTHQLYGRKTFSKLPYKNKNPLKGIRKKLFIFPFKLKY